MSKILSLHLHLYLTKKSVFFKLVKTLRKMHFLGLLKILMKKSVPRPYFLPHIMNGAFSALSLLKSPLWLRLGLLYAQDIKHMVFTAQDGPHPSKTLGKCTLLLSGSLAGSAAESPLAAILGPSWAVLGTS